MSRTLEGPADTDIEGYPETLARRVVVAATLAAELRAIEKGAALRAAYVEISTCQPAQSHYQKMLDRAAMIVEDASQTDYDKFLHEDYDPALASMKASCAELINADGLA